MACLRCRLRPMATPGVEQKNPQVTPEVTNFAVSDRDREVALRHQLAARRGGGALHLRDHRLRQALDGHHHRAALGKQVGDLRLLAQLADFLEVMAGAEALARGRQHHDADVLVLLDRIERVLQRRQHLGGQQVHLRRAVQGQGGDAVAVLAQQHGLLRLNLCAQFKNSSRVDGGGRLGLLAQHELLDLAGRGLRQLAEHHRARRLELRHAGTAELDDLLLGD